MPLVRNLLIFGTQYGIAVTLFRHPEAKASLAIAGHAVSGIWTGSESRSRSETQQQAFDIPHRAGHDDVCASRVQVCMVA